MLPRDWKLRVEDILRAIDRIAQYTQGIDFDAFSADQKTIDAVIRNFTVIGEAARGIPADIESANPQLPWREMRDMRNVVVHGYFKVDLGILWQTIQSDLPPLVAPLKALLKSQP